MYISTDAFRYACTCAYFIPRSIVENKTRAIVSKHASAWP